MQQASDFGFEMVLTITQALQLVGLAPCIFVVIFLSGLSFRNREAIVPAGYFVALGCGFARPLLVLYPSLHQPSLAMSGLLFGESLLAAFSFLLVIQFMLGRIPPWQYWLVLLIPMIGGGALVNTNLAQASEACDQERGCLTISTVEILYNIISSGFVFLLLVYYSSRSSIKMDDTNKRHKYWLIIALILLNLFVLAIDLAQVAGHLSADQSLFATTMLRLTFIYLAITSLFRVFYPGMMSEVVQLSSPAASAYNPERDGPYVAKIMALIEKERIFCEMRLNRAALAEKVGISEHHLSRVINGHFGKSFNELINGYRIDEAKRRLQDERDTQITVIGFEVGFNSIASFNRVFKEKVGVSPTEWRNTSSPSESARPVHRP